MIGEIGALGGGILPNLLGQSKQHTGSYRAGFLLYAVLAVGVLVVMRVVARSWTRSWIAPGGRAITASTHIAVVSVGSRDRDIEEIPA
jgi:NNP family nitrate/nitrite transporter-like MFS transporter